MRLESLQLLWSSLPRSKLKSFYKVNKLCIWDIKHRLLINTKGLITNNSAAAQIKIDIELLTNLCIISWCVYFKLIFNVKCIQTALTPQQFTLPIICCARNIQHLHSATRLCPHVSVSNLCPDRSSGLVFWGQGLPEEQLEHSGRDAGDDFCYWHPCVSHLQLGDQDSGHAESAEAAKDP